MDDYCKKKNAASSCDHSAAFSPESINRGLLTIGFFVFLIVCKLLLVENDTIPISANASVRLADSLASLATAEETIVGVLPTSTEKPNISLFRKIEGQLHEGESLVRSLKRLAVPDEAQRAIVDSLGSCLDLRKLMPKDKITVVLDGEDQLHRCTYEASPFEIYEVRRFEDSFSAIRSPVELDFLLEKLDGRVESSLFQAFSELGEKPSLVYAFADMFASRIDFNTETQQGDTFGIVVEKYYKDGNFIGYGKIFYASYELQETNRRLKGYFFERERGGSGFFDEEGKELGTSFLRSPVPIGRVTSRFSFNRKHPISGIVRPHLGVDLAAPVGTPIMAASDGKVIFSGVKGGFGKQIILQHGNGFRTHYGHLSRFAKNVKKGKYVKQKEIIGYVGSTGVSTGPHLDYRLEVNGVFKNPFTMKFKPRSILEGDTLSEFQKTVSRMDRYISDQLPEARTLQAKKVVMDGNAPAIML